MLSYLELLSELHRVLQPRSYLEVGVRHGKSLELASCPAIGVDPVPEVKVELGPDTRVFPMTSDAFFAAGDGLNHLPGRTIDLAFIDGMHLVEYAYRDVVNVEQHCGPGSVIAMDDMLPRTELEAARNRQTRAWTGDVWKVMSVLAERRPDLVLVPVAVRPTGVLVVLCPDRAARPEAGVSRGDMRRLRKDAAPPASVIDRSEAVDATELRRGTVLGDGSRGSHRAVDVDTLRAEVRAWQPRALTPRAGGQEQRVGPAAAGSLRRRARVPVRPLRDRRPAPGRGVRLRRGRGRAAPRPRPVRRPTSRRWSTAGSPASRSSTSSAGPSSAACASLSTRESSVPRPRSEFLAAAGRRAHPAGRRRRRPVLRHRAPSARRWPRRWTASSCTPPTSTRPRCGAPAATSARPVAGCTRATSTTRCRPRCAAGSTCWSPTRRTSLPSRSASCPPEARLHEPRVALDGGPDGLDILRRVIAGAPPWLAPGGHLLVETSEAQAAATADAVARTGLAPQVCARTSMAPRWSSEPRSSATG